MLVEVHLCGGDPVRDVLWFGGRCLLCREFFVWKCLYVKMFLCGNGCVWRSFEVVLCMFSVVVVPLCEYIFVMVLCWR